MLKTLITFHDTLQHVISINPNSELLQILESISNSRYFLNNGSPCCCTLMEHSEMLLDLTKFFLQYQVSLKGVEALLINLDSIGSELNRLAGIMDSLTGRSA